MNREVSLRQVAYMYLFISLSPILRQIPSALAREADRSGYLSPIWSTIPILILTGLLIFIIKAFPGLNIYEILVQLTGVFFAKIIILGYLIWVTITITSKLNIYSMTLQFTLMPQTRSDFFIIIFLILVFYALLKGIKTVFRFSEFALGPILLLIGVLFLCALSRLRLDYLLPVSTLHLKSTITASKNVITVGGNIIILLFFADKFGLSITKSQFRKLWYGSLVFCALAFVVTVFTYGVTGPGLTAKVAFPFYITVKSISIFNIFERFEVLVTLICVLSDFITICILSIILLRCFEWLFHLTTSRFLSVPLAILIYYLTYYINSTQFEFDFLYQFIIINLNLIFQYLIPALLILLYLLRRKKFQKQF